MPTITPITVQFPRHEESNGVLYVYECGRTVPFEVRRVFSVTARGGDVRGDHAHKRCAQLLVCMHGSIRVRWENDGERGEQVLAEMGAGLLIPPAVWSTQEYMVDGAVLMVLCDRLYEADDYIRDYAEFQRYLATSR